jgi:hypothetical protein
VISVSQQQRPDTVSIDEIPVDIDNTQSAEVDSADVPDEIESITRGLAGEQPPTNPIVVLKAARWWYIHGKGGTDPAFQWAIEWAQHLATDTPSDVDRFDAFCEYLVTLGFADEKAARR